MIMRLSLFLLSFISSPLYVVYNYLKAAQKFRRNFCEKKEAPVVNRREILIFKKP